MKNREKRKKTYPKTGPRKELKSLRYSEAFQTEAKPNFFLPVFSLLVTFWSMKKQCNTVVGILTRNKAELKRQPEKRQESVRVKKGEEKREGKERGRRREGGKEKGIKCTS